MYFDWNMVVNIKQLSHLGISGIHRICIPVSLSDVATDQDTV